MRSRPRENMTPAGIETGNGAERLGCIPHTNINRRNRMYEITSIIAILILIPVIGALVCRQQIKASEDRMAKSTKEFLEGLKNKLRETTNRLQDECSHRYVRAVFMQGQKQIHIECADCHELIDVGVSGDEIESVSDLYINSQPVITATLIIPGMSNR